MTAMLTRRMAPPATRLRTMFSALCARCDSTYSTAERKAPWLCPSCTDAPVIIRSNPAPSWVDAINSSWGAGS